LPNRHASATTVVPISLAGTTNGTSLAETAGLSTELISSMSGPFALEADGEADERGYCETKRSRELNGR
jgi:hypothetical protein